MIEVRSRLEDRGSRAPDTSRVEDRGPVEQRPSTSQDPVPIESRGSKAERRTNTRMRFFRCSSDLNFLIQGVVQKMVRFAMSSTFASVVISAPAMSSDNRAKLVQAIRRAAKAAGVHHSELPKDTAAREKVHFVKRLRAAVRWANTHRSEQLWHLSTNQKERAEDCLRSNPPGSRTKW